MPSHGQHSDLHIGSTAISSKKRSVNALSRAALRSTEIRVHLDSTHHIVLMPSHGQHSDLHEKEEKNEQKKNCVNALSRAALRSTVPPQKALFYQDF